MSFTDGWNGDQPFGTGMSTPSQNMSGLSLFPPLPPHDDETGRTVEHLEFRDLMNNHIFQELHPRWNVAANTIIETTQTNNSLLKEIGELRAEIQMSKTNEDGLPGL